MELFSQLGAWVMRNVHSDLSVSVLVRQLWMDTRKACTMQMESIAWQRHSPPSHRHQVFSSKFIASNDSGRLRSVGLPAEGLEPTRSCDHWILSPARLPVPPRRRRECETTRMRRKLKRFQRDREAADFAAGRKFREG